MSKATQIADSNELDELDDIPDGELVPPATIEKFVRQIAERFDPERIILFGSYAYGKPTPDSDVDILVIMNTPLREVEQAADIRYDIERPFALDILVRRPETIAHRLAMNDFFIQEIVERGKVVYERRH
jgi:predicted nucleotidyltransferase